MGKYLNIGNAGFEAVRRGLYVDKTGLISFINSTIGKKNKLTCVSRPRRFGKSFAAQMLCAYYEIIDEWDALFREAKDDVKLQKEYMDFLRSLFKSSWTDIIFDAAYITGILPIKKYGTQSAMTDFKEYTMLAPKKLAEYVGFTEAEVKNLCSQYSMDFEEAKRWYDGYSFSRVKSVYSPNSVIEAIESEEFGNYWTQTETYESLQFYIDLNEDGLKQAIIQMLGGAHIKIDVATFQNDMTTIKSRDDVLTLLVHLGYLAYDVNNKSVYIPNEEVREEFVRAVTTGKHTEIAKLIRNSEHLLEATLNLDEDAVAAAIEEAHK